MYQTLPKAFSKRKVLRKDFKESKDLVCLISACKEFHKMGSQMEKAQIAFVTNCDLGIVRWILSMDVNGWEETYQVKKPFLTIESCSGR